MPAPTERFLPVRVALILAAIALCQGFSACWITGSLGTWLPFSGSIPLTSLPHILCGLAVAMAALVAPFISGPGTLSAGELQTTEARPRLKLLQLIFTALWQSAMFCFFLMVCARLTPLDPAGITLATLWVAAFAFCCLTLAELTPRAYAGIIFFWGVAIPMVCYVTAEAYIYTSPGGWKYNGTGAVYSFLHGMLSISPATATAAVLDGGLPDGANPPSIFYLVWVALFGAAMRLWTRRARTAAQPAEAQARPAQ